MSRKIKIPVKGSQIFDMFKTREYVSIRRGNFYHKFFNPESFGKWLETGVIEFTWGETVWDLLRRGGYVCQTED